MFGFYFAILKRTANGETDNSISEVSTLVGTKIMRKAFMIIVFCIMYTGMMSHWTRSMTIDTVMPRLGSEWFGPILYQLFRYMVPICAIIIIYEVLQFPLWKKTLLIRTALVTAGKSSLPIYAMQWFFLGNSLGGYYETLIIRTLTATVMPWYLGKYVLQRFAITNQLLLGGRRG